MVAQAATTQGWTHTLRSRLAVYGRHPAPLVAAAAQFTLPPSDNDPDSEEVQ